MKNSGEKNFLMDGFPRNKENIDGWQKLIGDRVNILCVLVFDCDEKVKQNIYIHSFFSNHQMVFKRLVLLDVLNVVKQVDELMIMKKV